MSTADWCSPSGSEGDNQKDKPQRQGTVRVSYLCSHGWQPLLITGFLIDMLRRYWGSAENVLSPEMKQYIWRPGSSTGIVIDSVFRYQPDNVEKRPAVMVKRNAFKNMQVGLSAGLAQGAGVSAYPNEKGAIQKLGVLFVGSHTLFCIHKTGAATEILASEIVSQVVMATLPIRTHLGLRQFTVVDVGAVQPLAGEATENMVVPITVGWGFTFDYDLRLQSLPLQEISLTALLGSDGTVAMKTPYVGP